MKAVNWVHWLTLLMMMLLVYGIIALEHAQTSTHRVQKALVAMQAHQNDSLRTLLCFFQDRAQHSHQLTPAEKKDAAVAYGQALERIHEPPC